jgi:hypothetical protein
VNTDSGQPPPSRAIPAQHPPQAEHINVKVATVVGVVIALVTMTATTLTTVGAAYNRLGNLESRADRAERDAAAQTAQVEGLKLTVRDLQNRQDTLKDGQDAARRELADIKKSLGEASRLLMTICLSEERQRRTGTSCQVVAP